MDFLSTCRLVFVMQLMVLAVAPGSTAALDSAMLQPSGPCPDALEACLLASEILPSLPSALDDPPAPGPGIDRTPLLPSENGVWSSLDNFPAPHRLTASAAYDPTRNRMILFGGSDGSYRNSTWVLQLGETPVWEQLQTVGLPPAPRRLQSTIYDPVRDRLIVFGGFDDSYFNDVWELTFTGAPTWTPLTPTGAPPVPRAGHAAIYDPIGDRMIIFAGHDGVSPNLRVNDVWALTLAGAPAWTQLTPAGTPPTPRSSHTAIYDAPRQRLITFGGTTPAYLDETWELSLTGPPTWTQLTPGGTLPTPRESHTAIVDSNGDRMVIFGGINGYSFFNDAWELSLAGSTTWNQIVTDCCEPESRWGQTAIFDPVGDRMVMHGGWAYVYSAETRFLNLGTSPGWSELAPRRLSSSVILDPSRNRLVMFGGSDGQDRNDTWTISMATGAIWAKLPVAGAPPSPRRLHTAVYDPVRDRMIVFGGYAGPYHDDVWELTFSATPTWTQLTPSGGTPVARAGHSAVYDPAGDRMIVFAGHDGQSPTLRVNDVWELTLYGAPTWTELLPAGLLPEPRSSHSAVLDEPRDRMVVFGGTAPGYVNEVWELSLAPAPMWTELSVNGTPPTQRESHSAIIDPVRQRMVIFGGDDGAMYYADTWALNLIGTPTWSELSPVGSAPSPRWGHMAVYDAAALRMAVYGGWSSSYTGSLHFLTWDEPVPVDLASFEVSSRDGRVTISWRTTHETDHLGFNVQRASANPERFETLHEHLISASSSIGGDYAFIDDRVTPGSTYVYRLEAVGRGGERQLFPPRSVRVAAVLPGTLVLHQNHPNPFNPSTSIAFEIETPVEVRLNIYDAGGRWIRTLVDARLEADFHRVTWDGLDAHGHQVGSGIYIARLQVGSQVLTRKMVLAK